MRGVKQRILSRFMVLVIVVMTAMMPVTSYGKNISKNEQYPTSLEMTADLLVVRPLAIIATLVGTLTFVLSVPFSALGGNAGQAADAMVVAPFSSAFLRCLGCTEIMRTGQPVSNVEYD
jgi:hypothetical protein